MAGRIEVLVPAKVNLYLGVHQGTNGRGRHGVDTVMAAVDLLDAVMIEPAETLSVACVPPVPGEMRLNTCHRAATLLAERLGRDPAVSILVEKTIPCQAGLGGGSADAAGTLVALGRLWGLEDGDPLLGEVAASVGADVPFFLTGGCALMDDEGQHLVRSLPQPDWSYVLVRPRGEGVSTGEAYARFDQGPRSAGAVEPVVAALLDHDRRRLREAMANDLEPVALSLLDSLAEVHRWLSARPQVARAMVSGSGSAILGTCCDPEAAEDVAQAARDHGLWAEAAQPWEGGPKVVIDELTGRPLG